MPQLLTKARDTLYTEILTRIHTEKIFKYPTVITVMSGELQATPT
jgi:hypothetical protein